MGNTTKKLSELLESIEKGQLILPEIQRDFVWSRRNVLLLFDSLYKGLPIGHMLVWKTEKLVGGRKSVKFKHGDVIDSMYGYLLDGQQRLTAIGLVKDGHDDYPLMFSLRDGTDKNKFTWRSRSRKYDPWLMPVTELLDRHLGINSVIERLDAQIPDFNKDVHGNQVYGEIGKVQDILKYQVGITEFSSNDYNKATELFIRFNSTGKKLNRTDLALAELALKIPRFVSDDMNQTTSKLRADGYNFTPQFLIQCLAAVHINRLKLKDPEEFWNPKIPYDIKISWKKTIKGIFKVTELLSGTVHWKSSDIIPSFNTLIPLIYILARGKALSLSDRKLARKWLILATVHGYFSGQSDTKIDRLLRYLKNDCTITRLWKLSRKELPKLKADDFDTNRKSGAIMALYVSMLIDSAARDWGEGKTKLDGSVVGHLAGLEIHHIFPRALLFRNGYPSHEINTFANYAIISKGANINILAKEPCDYFLESKRNIDRKQLRVQCIPVDNDLWKVDKYKEFISKRRSILAKRANSYLNK